VQWSCVCELNKCVVSSNFDVQFIPIRVLSRLSNQIIRHMYELSTLTGTQVLLLVMSETGLVYTFTTSKLQPLVTQPEGKNLIQACLNASHGLLPSAMPVGTPIGHASGPMSLPGPGHLQLVMGLVMLVLDHCRLQIALSLLPLLFQLPLSTSSHRHRPCLKYLLVL
jgi:hypothetical protein